MFSRIFIERPRLAAVVSLILLLAGGISLANLPVAEYPEIAPPTLFVSATYSGASADVVAQTVAMPLENEINGVEGLLYFSSTSSNSGSYSCSVTFRSGTDSDIALVNLQNAVKRAEAQLPSEVTKAGITVEKRGNDILAMLAFQTDGTSLSLNELVNYVNNNVKDALARLEGVSSSDMMSQQEYAMRIWMDPLRMSGLGISSSEIRSAVESQNVQAAAGTLGAELAVDIMDTKSPGGRGHAGGRRQQPLRFLQAQCAGAPQDGGRIRRDRGPLRCRQRPDSTPAGRGHRGAGLQQLFRTFHLQRQGKRGPVPVPEP